MSARKTRPSQQLDHSSPEYQLQQAVRMMVIHLCGMAVTSRGADSAESAAVVREELVATRHFKLPNVLKLTKMLQRTPEYAHLERDGKMRWQIKVDGPPIYPLLDWEARLTSCCQGFALPRRLGQPERNEFVCRCCGQIELRFWKEDHAKEYLSYYGYRGELRANTVATTLGRPCAHHQ